MRLLAQRLVVIVARGVGIEREVKLVVLAELKARRQVRPKGPARSQAPHRTCGMGTPSRPDDKLRRTRHAIPRAKTEWRITLR